MLDNYGLVVPQLLLIVFQLIKALVQNLELRVIASFGVRVKTQIVSVGVMQILHALTRSGVLSFNVAA